MTDKTYKIGEAASMLNLKPYVLRFWETEFPQINPLRTDKGQRLYTKEDVEFLERIRFLLHEQGLTIDGARKIIEKGPTAKSKNIEAAYAALGAIPSYNLPLGQSADKNKENLSLEKIQNTDRKQDKAAQDSSSEQKAKVPQDSSFEQKTSASSTGLNREKHDKFIKSLIEELEEVAMILRNPSKSGNFLQ